MKHLNKSTYTTTTNSSFYKSTSHRSINSKEHSLLQKLRNLLLTPLQHRLQLLSVLHHLLTRNIRQCQSLSVSPARPSNPMHITLNICREVIAQHHLNIGHINAPR